jgi:GNAT superfamily N-acetyltransferase
MASEKNLVVDWVNHQFGEGWASECEISFSRRPISCLLALFDDHMVGFSCHDCTCRNFFGPIGTDPLFRRKGIGKGLLLATLQAMANNGYAYAIIGNAGPTEFFEKCAGATIIPGSTPGIYRPSRLGIPDDNASRFR